MKSENTDPRLTAHALGELHGEELEKLEAELAEDEHARDELEAIRSTSALLERELGKPSGLKLEAKHLERARREEGRSPAAQASSVGRAPARGGAPAAPLQHADDS